MNMLGPAKAAKRLGLRHPNRGLFLIAAAIVVAIVALAGLAIWNARQSAFQEEERDASNLAFALAEQTARYVQTVDLTMMQVKSWVTELDGNTPAAFKSRMRSAEIHQRLVEHGASVLQAHAIALIGADGEVLNSSRPQFVPGFSIAGRDFYEYLKIHDDPDLVVGTPAASHTSGNPSLYFARRLNSPNQ
jgi:hypothetical protein